MTEGVLSRISRVASSSLPNAALVNDADRISVGDVREVMRLLADRAPAVASPPSCARPVASIL